MLPALVSVNLYLLFSKSELVVMFYYFDCHGVSSMRTSDSGQMMMRQKLPTLSICVSAACCYCCVGYRIVL